MALDGIPPENMIPELLAFPSGISDEFNQAISKVNECLEYDDEEKALKALGEGWIGEEAVALALYCFLKSPDDYVQTVLRGANTSGDSESVACIAGSISGARLGFDAIPSDWCARIEKSDYLSDLSTRLFKKTRSHK